MSKLESELRDHALTLIHQDYLLVEKQIQGLSERISIELNLISESARQVPDNINKSLTNIADALEDAEKTASNLSNEARQTILAIKESEIDAIRREIFTGVKTEVDKTQEVAENIRKTLLSYPDAFRPKAPVAALLIFSVILMTSIIASSMFSWSMYKQNDETHRALLTLDYKYMQQEKVIQTLPAEYRNKFPK